MPLTSAQRSLARKLKFSSPVFSTWSRYSSGCCSALKNLKKKRPIWSTVPKMKKSVSLLSSWPSWTWQDRKSTRLNSSHVKISYAVHRSLHSFPTRRSSDLFNQRAAEPRQKAEVQQSRIQHLEQVQQRLLQRIEKLKEEKANLVDGTEDEEIGQLTEQLAELDLAADEKRTRVDVLTEQLDQQRNDNNRLTNELDQVRSKLQSMRGRHASLEALQQAALGEKNKAVTQWLETQQLLNKPRLAESINVTDGWDKALETVLGDALQAVCVEGFDAVKDVLGNLTQGELVLFDTGAQVS